MSGGGLWEDADAANEASLQQIIRSKGGSMGAPYNPPVKRWQDMSEAEQRADIAARQAAKREKDSNKKSTQQSQSFQGVSQSTSTCYHDGELAAFTLCNKRLIVAGAKAHSVVHPPPDTGLVIDLCGQVKFNMKPWVVSAPEALTHLKVPPPVPPDYLHLDWPDRGEPRCDIAWWQSFLADLEAKYLDKRVIICCVGSHGRTGTAMAALILASSPDLSVEATIKFVRKNHCHKAIESDDQVEYLRMFRPKENSKWLDDAATDNRDYKQWSQGGVTYHYKGGGA